MTWTMASSHPSSAPLYGAIDLGTNTCRLLIGQPVRKEEDVFFEPINSFSRIIRFGEDLDSTEHLSQAAMKRAYLALEECMRRIQLYKVPYIRAVATAACRRAQNAEEFIRLAKEKTELDIEIISPQEESELAVAGCIDLLDPQIPYAIVFDIGGGSTEIVWIKMQGAFQFEVCDCLSLPYGVLSLRDSLCSDSEKIKMRDVIASEVHAFAVKNGLLDLLARSQLQMVGASGTVTTLAALILQLERYDRVQVHETRLWQKDLNPIIQKLWAMNRTSRIQHPCIGPQRADFILGGVTIFQGIYQVFPIEPTVVADRGVREGILRQLFKQYPSTLENLRHSSSAA